MIESIEEGVGDLAPADAAGGGAEVLSPPPLSAPKGGGAIRGIAEQFSVNPATGSAALTLPLPLTKGRSGFGPQLSLGYDSSAGNGAFGLGWSLSLAAVSLRTDRGLPRYRGDDRIMLGGEELVPLLDEATGWRRPPPAMREFEGRHYRVERYRPRIEAAFARIELWRNPHDPADRFWRTLSRDNVTTYYGRHANSRIADPEEPARIFRWLVSETHDDRGNLTVYRYKAEDAGGVDLGRSHERNRPVAARIANRYPKRIRYGNVLPYRPGQSLNAAAEGSFHFEAVFDYGDMDPERPIPGEERPWPVRPDTFSSYRSAFEVRTYRLCQRVLMFHHFLDESEIGENCLVRALELEYSHDRAPTEGAEPVHAILSSTRLAGYRRKGGRGYRKRALPPLELSYSKAEIQDAVRDVDPASLANLPTGVDGTGYRWADLDGEGAPGILAETAGRWAYKRNLSPAFLSEPEDPSGQPRFAPLEPLAQQPVAPALRSGRHRLMDLAGDGRLDVVELEGGTPGFFKRGETGGWETFRAFHAVPRMPAQDENRRLVDLTGDGLADILHTADGVHTWYASLGEEGFAAPERLAPPHDEAAGPALVFANREQSVHLADMSGDGLQDLVRLRNGEVCYWPNLGYGRFGPKVTMDDAPWFELPEAFDPRRLIFADVDGSGLTDIVYAATDGLRLYYNLSGNAWSAPRGLTGVPTPDRLTQLTAIDLFGNGTACLTWSSALPGESGAPLRYLDLMGGRKPHLLVGVKNNLGAETRVGYAPSTKFYVEDRLAGRPWRTKPHFQVQCVERVETLDHVNRTRFVTRRRYRHGFYDPLERRFAGFAFVETWDTEEFAALSASGRLSPEDELGENIDLASHVPPVLTRSWFHTGAWLESDFGRVMQHEYWREPGAGEAAVEAALLPDTLLPEELDSQDRREACRALEGALLRREVYGLDGTSEAELPYSVTEQNSAVRQVQPRGQNRHAVFFAHASETVTFHYERRPADPRIGHSAVLEVDAYGSVLKSAAVAYGRRQADPALAPRDQAEQARLHVTCALGERTNVVDLPDAYRTPLAAQGLSYELTGLTLSEDSARLGLETLREAVAAAEPIAFHARPTPGRLQKRLLGHNRTYFRSDDLERALPLGILEARALVLRTEELAFTAEHLEALLSARVGEGLLESEGGYRRDPTDGSWWIPSSRVYFTLQPNADPAAELAEAEAHFWRARRFVDPFGAETSADYDRYDLAVIETRDAFGNRVTAGERGPEGIEPRFDYRVFQPSQITDPNGNRTVVAFDTLGLVVGSAVMGKPHEGLGDTLEDFVADLSPETIAAFFADPRGPPAARLLGNATTRIVYDTDRPMREGPSAPAFAATIARETHVSDGVPAGGLRLQVRFAYSNGLGQVVQNKIQAEPARDVEGGLGAERWIGSGWTILNNKGAPVRQYEPYRTARHDFEFARIEGVSPIVCYDPLGRAVATLHPNHAWEKIVFNPWRQESHDANDTVLIDPALDLDVGGYFQRLPKTEFLPTWHGLRSDPALAERAAKDWPAERRLEDEAEAAVKTTAHAGTPGRLYLDSLGRAFLSVVDPGTGDGPFETRNEQDIEGLARRVLDGRGNTVVEAVLPAEDGSPGGVIGYDMTGRQIYRRSMDGGEERILPDISGNPLCVWDSRGHLRRPRYDIARRTTHVWVTFPSGDEILTERTLYGEDHPQAEALNLRGQAHRVYDGAGLVTTDRVDFKGNPLELSRRLAREYREPVDWRALAEETDVDALAAAAEPLLEAERFVTTTRYDALDRPTTVTTPDASVTEPTYNEAGLLESVEVRLRGATHATPFVRAIEYDTKGQRERIRYATADGADVVTAYTYEPDTLRLSRMSTRRGSDGGVIQDLRYAYDPTGNITSIRDEAQQSVYFANRVVEPHISYWYDALSRLVRAEGREHAIGSMRQVGPERGAPEIGIPFPNSPTALQRYREDFSYDSVGNILRLAHSGGGRRWTRFYQYASGSNRLLATSAPGEPDVAAHATHVYHPTLGERYAYDEAGNMVAMPHLSSVRWDHNHHLQASVRQVVREGTPETTYYVYDSGGNRVRKVTERAAGHGDVPSRAEERLYLGGVEVKRRYGSCREELREERHTLHVMDDARRIALIETQTVEDGHETLEDPAIRFQLDNHLGSVCLEVDHQGKVITYEEYHPFGTSALRTGRSVAETSLKRYHFAGKERDEETGLQLHGLRYYAPWLGRWVSADPAGLVGGQNAYSYVSNDPVGAIDPTGTTEVRPEDTYAREAVLVDENDNPIEGEGAVTVISFADDPRELMTPEEQQQAQGPKRRSRKTEEKRDVLAVEVDPEQEANREIQEWAKSFGTEVMMGRKQPALLPANAKPIVRGAFVVGFSAGVAGDAGTGDELQQVFDIFGQKVGKPIVKGSAEQDFTIEETISYAIPVLRGARAAAVIVAERRAMAAAMRAEAEFMAAETQAGLRAGTSPAFMRPFLVAASRRQAAVVGTRSIQAHNLAMKNAAGQILGVDTHRAGQVIVTAEVEVAGARFRVAIPNSSAGWRPEQMQMAREMGFEPLSPVLKGSNVHAEVNLDHYLKVIWKGKNARVVRWSLARGRGGTSNICLACQRITDKWPPVERF